jgi:hypothetical protein
MRGNTCKTDQSRVEDAGGDSCSRVPQSFPLCRKVSTACGVLHCRNSFRRRRFQLIIRSGASAFMIQRPLTSRSPRCVLVPGGILSSGGAAFSAPTNSWSSRRRSSIDLFSPGCILATPYQRAKPPHCLSILAGRQPFRHARLPPGNLQHHICSNSELFP